MRKPSRRRGRGQRSACHHALDIPIDTDRDRLMQSPHNFPNKCVLLELYLFGDRRPCALRGPEAAVAHAQIARELEAQHERWRNARLKLLSHEAAVYVAVMHVVVIIGIYIVVR